MVGLDAAHGIDLVDFARVLAGSRRAEDGPAHLQPAGQVRGKRKICVKKDLYNAARRAADSGRTENCGTHLPSVSFWRSPRLAGPPVMLGSVAECGRDGAKDIS